MAELKITIPDGIVTRVLNGVCYSYGYQDTIGEAASGTAIANPQSKAAFAKDRLKVWVKDNIRSYEVGNATEIARNETVSGVNSDIVL